METLIYNPKPSYDPVHQRLFKRFFSNTQVNIDASASSHWKECSKFFHVSEQNNGEFTLKGYGFGGQDSFGKKSQLISFIGVFLQLIFLGDLGLIKGTYSSIKIVNRMGLSFSQDAFRQVCTFYFLENFLQQGKTPKRILIIGDGPGILSALLQTRFPNAQIILADLGQVLFFQSYQLKKAFPNVQQWISDEDKSVGMKGFVFCPADYLESIPNGQIDLAINIASMQEFDPSIIEL